MRLKIDSTRSIASLLCRNMVIAALRLLFHLHTLWLFTFSDLKTIVGPKSLFGIINGLSTIAFQLDKTAPGTLKIISRSPLIVIWVWTNLLPFAIDNQRQPDAVEEDKINKPWRPLPSKRMSPEQAKKWMLCLYPVAICVSFLLGGLKQCIALLVLGIWYNDFAGADSSCFSRNLINACGFVSYASGAMEVALGQSPPTSPTMVSWFVLIAMVVFSSVHSQDLPDLEGDRVRGRCSVPLTMGEAWARWTIAVSVGVFSFYCPYFWSCQLLAYFGPTLLGCCVLRRTLSQRSRAEDKVTFRYWNLWMATLYCLPLLKSFELR